LGSRNEPFFSIVVQITAWLSTGLASNHQLSKSKMMGGFVHPQRSALAAIFKITVPADSNTNENQPVIFPTSSEGSSILVRLRL
jgi:hypothetical protein